MKEVIMLLFRLKGKVYFPLRDLRINMRLFKLLIFVFPNSESCSSRGKTIILLDEKRGKRNIHKNVFKFVERRNILFIAIGNRSLFNNKEFGVAIKSIKNMKNYSRLKIYDS
jgi:hypothetical protein